MTANFTKSDFYEIAFNDAVIQDFCNLDGFYRSQFYIEQNKFVSCKKDFSGIYIADICFIRPGFKEVHVKVTADSFKELLQNVYDFIFA